tara:strand:- start:4529 stop:5146 length:618 start_codon:yes stop_codon:yes gene_type:complete
MLRILCRSIILTVSLTAIAACSGGSGGPSVPQIAANVPDGAGSVTIAMTGSWEIRNAVVIDSNSANPVPPLNGTTFTIQPDKVVSIGGLPVDPDGLALLLGAPLDSYVNEVSDRTLFYGLVVDRRAAGMTREEVAVAGGSLNADTIAVEAYSSSQSPAAADPVFTLSRYELVRVAPAAPAAPVELLAEGEQRTLQALLQEAFGSR